MSTARDLADRFHERWLEQNPFAASMYGIPGYDDLVPDESEEGARARRAEAERFVAEADEIAGGPLTPADAVTLDCTREAAAQEIAIVDMAPEDHTVTAMQYSGAALFMAVAARTVLVDVPAAEAYLIRLRRGGEWLDQIGERLRAGAGKGRFPVAPLAEQAIAWAEGVLAAPVSGTAARTGGAAGWDGTAEWEAQRRAVAAEVIRPALARWVATVRDLLPRARPSSQAGLVPPAGRRGGLRPGGADLHDAAAERGRIAPDRPGSHRRAGGPGRGARRQAGPFRAGRGHEALRDSAGKITPAEAIREATVAVRRAEARAAEVFPAPLPPPCEVTPMPEVVAVSGAAPHYTPPRLDGGRPGTFWFNTERPTAGTGWDIEVVAFHEAVPGHHLQLSRLQLLTELPALQRQRSLPVFSEGWGLYAEQLAEEIGLYADERGLLGSISTSLMRAARLVVDTGLHFYGWSREQALEFAVTHVPMPREFLASEIDRYVVMPGQALSYLTGQLEILRIREEARLRLGEKFSLPAFHAAVLDQGSLPMPTLARSIAGWLERAG